MEAPAVQGAPIAEIESDQERTRAKASALGFLAFAQTQPNTAVITPEGVYPSPVDMYLSRDQREREADEAEEAERIAEEERQREEAAREEQIQYEVEQRLAEQRRQQIQQRMQEQTQQEMYQQPTPQAGPSSFPQQ